MNPNKTPTSRRNRPDTPQPQEEHELGFQAFTQPGYRPQFHQQIPQQFSQHFPPSYSQQFPSQFPPQFSQEFPQQFHQQFPQHIPYQLTRPGLMEHGCTPANYNLPSPAINLDDDIVPETQHDSPHTPQSISTQQSIPEPSNPTRKGKGKMKQYENRAPKQMWTKAEELALVSAWVDVSEDPVVGNFQNREGFWTRVGHSFFSLMGRENYRTTHQLNTKFNDLNKRINVFGGIYNNLLTNRGSGMSDLDISRTAHERYQAQVGGAFTLEQAWEVLKQCPKWGAVPPMSTTSSRGSKRTNPSNDDDDENFMEQLQRPIGRNKAKKTSTSNTSGTNTNESVTQLFTTFNEKIDDQMEYKMKKLDIELKKLEHEQEIERAQRFEKDFAFYMTPHDHLTGTALSVTLARKEQIRKFHDW